MKGPTSSINKQILSSLIISWCRIDNQVGYSKGFSAKFLEAIDLNEIIIENCIFMGPQGSLIGFNIN